MLFELWVGAILLALWKGGSFANVNNIRFRLPYLIISCLGLYLVLFTFHASLHQQLTSLIYGFVLLLLLASLYVNRRIPGMLLVLVGLSLNFIVIYANGGLMPVSVEGLSQAGLGELQSILVEGDGKHQVLDEQTRFWWLGDLIPLPRPYGAAQVVSLGDLILSLGMTYFCFRALKPRDPDFKLNFNI